MDLYSQVVLKSWFPGYVMDLYSEAVYKELVCRLCYGFMQIDCLIYNLFILRRFRIHALG